MNVEKWKILTVLLIASCPCIHGISFDEIDSKVEQLGSESNRLNGIFNKEGTMALLTGATKIFSAASAAMGVISLFLPSSKSEEVLLLEKMMETLDRIESNIGSLKGVVRCESAKQVIRTQMDSGLKKLSDDKVKYLKPGSEDEKFKRRRAYAQSCAGEQGINKIIAEFSLMLREDDTLTLLDDCADFKEDGCTHWALYFVETALTIQGHMTACSMVTDPGISKQAAEARAEAIEAFGTETEKRIAFLFNDFRRIKFRPKLDEVVDKKYRKDGAEDTMDYLRSNFKFYYWWHVTYDDASGYDQHCAIKITDGTKGGAVHVLNAGDYDGLVGFGLKENSDPPTSPPPPNLQSNLQNRRTTPASVNGRTLCEWRDWLWRGSDLCAVLAVKTYAGDGFRTGHYRDIDHDGNNYGYAAKSHSPDRPFLFYGWTKGACNIIEDSTPPAVAVPDIVIPSFTSQLADQIESEGSETRATVVRATGDLKKGQGRIITSLGDAKQELLTDNEHTRNRIDTSTNRLLEGQEGIKADIRATEGRLHDDHLRIEGKIEDVHTDVKYFGNRGIKERAEILGKVEHYGEIGITQRKEILGSLGTLHGKVGDIRETQLKESHLSKQRFDWTKGKLINIQEVQKEESQRAKQRFQVLNTGIQEVNKGVNRVESFIHAESRLSEQRHVTVVKGLNNIRDFQQWESKRADNRFNILNNGLGAIQEVQTENFQKLHLTNQEIIAKQQLAAKVGAQQFESLKGGLEHSFKLLGDLGIGQDEIKFLISEESQRSTTRFQWISTGIEELNATTRSIERKQDWTIHLLGKLDQSIAYNAEVVGNSIASLSGQVVIADDKLERLHQKTDVVQLLLLDIRNILKSSIATRANITKLIEEQTFRDYHDKSVDLDVLWAAHNERYQFQGDIAFLNTFQRTCDNQNPSIFLTWLQSLLKAGFDRSPFSRPSLKSTLASVVGFQPTKFQQLIMPVILQDSAKAALLAYQCAVNQSPKPTKAGLKFIAEKVQHQVGNITTGLLHFLYQIPQEFVSRGQLWQDVNELLNNNLNDNNAIVKKVYAKLNLKYPWYAWSVFIFNNQKVNTSFFHTGCPSCSRLTSSGGLHMNQLFDEVSSQTKSLVVWWQPRHISKSIQSTDTESFWETMTSALLELTDEKIWQNSNTNLVNNFQVNHIIEYIRRSIQMAGYAPCNYIIKVHSIELNDEEQLDVKLRARFQTDFVNSRVVQLDGHHWKVMLEVFMDPFECYQTKVISSRNLDPIPLEYLNTMPCHELAQAENPVDSIETIERRLGQYFLQTWAVAVVSRATATGTTINSTELSPGIRTAHIQCFGFDLLLSETTSVIEQTDSVLKQTLTLPSKLTLSGNAPCEIQKNGIPTIRFYQWGPVIHLKYSADDETPSFVRCSGPMFMQLLGPRQKEPDRNCTVGIWNTWTSCSTSCGPGTRSRIRWPIEKKTGEGAECPPLKQEESCETQPCPVDCTMSDWSTWSSCSKTCDGGKMARQRTSDGSDCEIPGHSVHKEDRSCGAIECDQDCIWGSWSVWSACSNTCNRGIQQRRREANQKAKNNGAPCTGGSIEQQFCQSRECAFDCTVSDWSGWSSCSETCGSGVKTRTRTITTPATGGRQCSAELREVHSCNSRECPPPSSCIELEGTDVGGPVIKSFFGKSRSDCCDLCSQQNGCRAWAWNNFRDGGCYLKSEINGFFPMANTWSGFLQGDRHHCIEHANMDLGRLCRNSGVCQTHQWKSKEECCALCAQTNGCKAYAFDQNGGWCYLKDAYYPLTGKDRILSSYVFPAKPHHKVKRSSFPEKKSEFEFPMNILRHKRQTPSRDTRALSLVGAHLEYTTMEDNTMSSELASAVCFQLRTGGTGKLKEKILNILQDSGNADDNWSLFVLDNPERRNQTWVLNYGFKLFLSAVCTWRAGSGDSMVAKRFILSQTPKKLCNTDIDQLYLVDVSEVIQNSLPEYAAIITLLNLPANQGSALSFGKFSIKASTVTSAHLLQQILTAITTVIDRTGSEGRMGAPLIRQNLGRYWNAIVAPKGDLLFHQVDALPKSFIHLEYQEWEIVTYLTYSKWC